MSGSGSYSEPTSILGGGVILVFGAPALFNVLSLNPTESGFPAGRKKVFFGGGRAFFGEGGGDDAGDSGGGDFSFVRQHRHMIKRMMISINMTIGMIIIGQRFVWHKLPAYIVLHEQ
jgi:hypothetical protein